MNVKNITMSVLQLEQDLQQMAGKGQLLEAFDKFYADEVVMHEGNGDVFEGKAANRKRQEQKEAQTDTHMKGGNVSRQRFVMNA